MDVSETEIYSVQKLQKEHETPIRKMGAKGVTTVQNLKSIISVIRDFDFFAAEKWKIASDKHGSGNTANIGCSLNLEDLKNENGIFSQHANPHIINFYKSVQDGNITPLLMKQYLQEEGEKLRTAENNGYEHYLTVRSRFNSGAYSPFDFIFLSRAGFNGMMRFGSKGNWNIPFCKKPDRFAQAYVTKIVNQLDAVSQIIQPEPNWIFYNKSFTEIIPLATENDIIYCDPPYYGRHVDYYNGWTEKDEEQLFHLLLNTKAKFILSTWHHNDWRENEMTQKYWNIFNIITKDHFYHNGGNIENRRKVVEALVCNFNTDGFIQHNHGLKEKQIMKQLELLWDVV